MTCCYYVDDAPAIFEALIRKARKSHKCCECGREIKAGDDYEVAKGLWDGSWSTYKTCEKCSDLRESVSESMCGNFGELYDDYEYLVGRETADKVFGREIRR